MMQPGQADRAWEIRPMEPHELEAVVSLWERARWSAQPWLEERMGYSHEDNLSHFERVVLAQNAVWLALDEDRIVGFMAISGSGIDQLYVEPEFQRRGVGTALLAKARELSPAELTLYTHQRNTGARAFYERSGFRAVAFGVSPPPESEPDVAYRWYREA